MIKGKKVLFVHSSAGLYGSDRCLLWISRDLIDRGIEVDAVLPFSGPLQKELEDSGVTVHLIDPVVFRRNLKKPAELVRFLGNAIPAVIRLRKLILEKEFDLVHTNTGVVVGGAMAAKMTKTRHVWHFREILSEFGFLWRFHEPLVSLTSDEIICISRAVASQFKGRRVQKKLNVIYDGIPVSGETPVKRKRNDKGSYRLLSVGLLAPYKGQDILIRSLDRLLKQGLDVQLDLVGGVFGGQTEFKQHLQDLASELGLQKRIRFLGFQDKIGPFLEASDIFILPSTRPEGLGIVILEAMAKGVPVVATNHGGTLEIIRDGENGILVPPNDHLAMAAAIENLIKNPERAEQLGAIGYDTVVKRFSLVESQKYLLNLYNRAW